jgi:hypothetical protein
LTFAEDVSEKTSSFDLSGNVRGLYLGVHDQPFGSSHDGGLMLLRLIAKGSLDEGVFFEFHLLERGEINPLERDPLGFSTHGEGTRFRADRLSHLQTAHEDFAATVEIDRANIRLRLPKLDLVVGRQAITFGTTYFWNPNDLLTTFAPFEFDRDFKSGVDGVRAEIPMGEFSGLSLLYGAGDKFRLNESALLARFFTNWLGFDLSLMGGRYREDGYLGMDFSGEIGPGIGFRGEVAQLFAEEDADFVQVVIGADYRFSGGLYVSGEYYFSGWGTTHESRYVEKILSERFRQFDLFNVGRHYLGILGSYEVSPLLIVSLAFICNLTDGSLLVDPTLFYSLGDNAEVLAGMIIGEGSEPRGFDLESEYGSYPDFLFVEFKYYF